MTSDGTGGVRRDRVRREGFPVVLMTIVKPLMRCYRVGASIGCSKAGLSRPHTSRICVAAQMRTAASAVAG